MKTVQVHLIIWTTLDLARNFLLEDLKAIVNSMMPFEAHLGDYSLHYILNTQWVGYSIIYLLRSSGMWKWNSVQLQILHTCFSCVGGPHALCVWVGIWEPV